MRARNNGAEIVGLCLGAFVLGYAGLLDGKRAATHWEFEQDFQHRFPQVRLDINALYVDDQRIITSAGTAAALDCCLYIIRQRYGSLAANQIARRLIVSPHREGGQAQFIAQPVPKNTRDARINCLLDYLQQHIAEPHNLDSLARVVAMSRRSLTRHFARATGMSITDWLTAERLRRSQSLLEAGICRSSRWRRRWVISLPSPGVSSLRRALASVRPNGGVPSAAALSRRGSRCRSRSGISRHP
ncbi:AraC family transcriptional regulator [Klebsiella quasipneumoniae]|nr:AraC family transcriptional regulator [Klebsiella quasipneumoniae]